MKTHIEIFMSKYLIILFSYLLHFTSQGQEKEKILKSDSINKQVKKTEIFNSGFIDIINNGQINASARLIRLYIGEQGKFSIPLSFYGGVSSNNFQNQNSGGSVLTKSNDHLVSQYINPLSGLINVSIEDMVYFKKSDRVTKTAFLYQFGERVLNGVRIGLISDPRTGKPSNFLNGFATAGLYFQTGAWERTNSKNVGIFWLASRYHFCYSNPNQIKQFLPDIETNGIYTGYSVGFGIEINNLVNIKAVYYKYTKAPEIDYGLPIYQFSFNYTMNKN